MMQYKNPQKFLGPSQVATVLGYNNYETMKDLRIKMEQGYTQPIKDCMRAGVKHESSCRTLYARETSLKVRKAPFVVDPLCSRLGGIADGLIGKDGGLEIKCQYSKPDQPPCMYFSYKIQSVVYMYLYKRDWWDIMVCKVKDGADVNAIIERVYFADYENAWKKWYPLICAFIESVKWHDLLKK
jgi:hypothetical protein